MTKTLTAALAAALALGAAIARAEVTATDAWVRGTVAAQPSTAAFMKLKSSADVKLVSAATPAAKVVELHQMGKKGAVMYMQAVEAIELPAGKTVELTSRGYHVMLMDLAKPLGAGDTVPLRLTFEDKDGKRTTLEVKAEVRPLTTTPMPKK